MLPIPATLTYANKSPELLGLLPLVAVSPITPTSAEQAAWARLKPGAMYQAQVIEQTQHEQAKQIQQYSASATVMSRVQIQQADNQIVQMWMNLPAGMAGKQLQLQFAGKPNQLNPQVKWQLAGETALKQLQANQIGLSVPINLEIDDDATLSNIPIQAAKVQLSDTGKTLNAWRESSLFPSQTQTYEARQIVSLHPERPQVLAQDLKHALDSSGLFYESHLKNASLGTQSWQSLSQEPQNQAQFVPASMVAQQLQVLEQQRVVWHGEVWPGQNMTWQVIDTDKNAHPHQSEQTVSAMQSELSLTLPQLGAVKVQLSLVDGHLQVQMSARDPDTLDTLQGAKMTLAMNMVRAGLKLEGLSMRLEETADDAR
jgi:Flagellar hook-length control protein FliK